MLVIIKFFRYQKCYNTRWPVYKFVFQLLWCPYSSTRCLLSLLLIRCNTFLKELFFYKYRHCCGTRIHCKWYVSYQLLKDIIYLHLEHQFIMNEILNKIELIITITQNYHHFHAVMASTISLFGHSTASV